jgi:hypothetical protein
MRMVAWCIAHQVAALHDSWELAASLPVSISLPRRPTRRIAPSCERLQDLLDRIAVRVADAVLRKSVWLRFPPFFRHRKIDMI